MIYEWRVYEAVPGKLPALHQRFQNVTVKLFKKHGFNMVGFWTYAAGPSDQLVYMLAWENVEQRDKAFAAFAADPERQTAFTESERDGTLVARINNYYLRPTAYSPMQ